MRRVALAIVATAVGMMSLLSFKSYPIKTPTAAITAPPLPARERKPIYLLPLSPTTQVVSRGTSGRALAYLTSVQSTGRSPESVSGLQAKVTTTTVPKPVKKTATKTTAKTPAKKKTATKTTAKTPAKKKPVVKKKPAVTTTTIATNGPHAVSGSVVTTQYGPVQVQITVANGKITAANAIKIPDMDDLDREINDGAVPILNQQVVDRQSAALDAISGATYTYNGYVKSLQAAIDKAKL